MHSDLLLQGFVGFQHLCVQQLWALMWPDLFHKAARKASGAIRRLNEGLGFLRRLMALHRFSRGPFKSSRFGRIIADSRDRLADVLSEDPENGFVQTWLAGIAKDVAGWANCEAGLTDFTAQDLLAILKKRRGRSSRTDPVHRNDVACKRCFIQASFTSGLIRRRMFVGFRFTTTLWHWMLAGTLMLWLIASRGSQRARTLGRFTAAVMPRRTLSRLECLRGTCGPLFGLLSQK